MTLFMLFIALNGFQANIKFYNCSESSSSNAFLSSRARQNVDKIFKSHKKKKIFCECKKRLKVILCTWMSH